MSPLCGLGMSSCVVFLVVTHIICALKLNPLPQATIGETVMVSWTSDSTNPANLSIELSCPSYMGVLNTSVPQASHNCTVLIPPSLSSNTSNSLSCNLQALAADNTSDVLGQVSVTVVNSITTASADTQPSHTSAGSSGITADSSNTLSTPGFISASSSIPPSTTVINTMTVNNTSSSPSLSFSRPSTEMATPRSSSSSASTCSTCTTSSMLSSVLPQTNSPAQATAKSTGAIIGGVVGGLLGLLVLATLLFLCWRRSRRRHLSHFPSMMPDVKSNMSSVPLSTNQETLLTAGRGTPSEALNLSAAGSQNNHSGSSSLGHEFLLTRQQIPDDTHAPIHYTRFSENLNTILVPVPPATPTEEDWKPQHTYHRPSYSTSSQSSSTTEEIGPSDETRQPPSSSPRSMIYKEINQSSTDVLDIESMDPEEREQRRDALLQRMRRVLDGEQSV